MEFRKIRNSTDVRVKKPSGVFRGVGVCNIVLPARISHWKPSYFIIGIQRTLEEAGC